jgi:DNA-binding response OmpR family regulator
VWLGEQDLRRASASPGGYTVSAQVLIVDDEKDVIQALKLRLETAGYQALTASDGAEALEMLYQGDVDLILADLMMPNLDGLELTRRIRQDSRWVGVQVLLFSCLDDPVARRLALEFGALDYLSKAVGARVIVSRVHEILDVGGRALASVPGRVRSDQVEEILGAQLRALSRSKGATDREVRVPGRPSVTTSGGSAEVAKDLRNLAESLKHARRSSRDRSGSVS